MTLLFVLFNCIGMHLFRTIFTLLNVRFNVDDRLLLFFFLNDSCSSRDIRYLSVRVASSMLFAMVSSSSIALKGLTAKFTLLSAIDLSKYRLLVAQVWILTIALKSPLFEK